MATILYKKRIINLNVVLAKFYKANGWYGGDVSARTCAKMFGESPYFWTKCLNALEKRHKIKKWKTRYTLDDLMLEGDDWSFINGYWAGYDQGKLSK